ncbi:hypothetical protein PHAVU_011G111500 [Phaseolus vulgaris]|uniref:Uncharacterized protein n=1 Tax=Phaseolus vulgaris TaxID=3885 RepID=V7AH95_PHAVU|nr:hypothetical protein PHAVU_011G111500g [Phaseolus vulgaris]ESW04625.1 hypothetical protein PHAVU_011G111500g [Phaseolus vulgaris]
MTFTTVPLIPCEKLIGTSNYSSWAAVVQLWFQGNQIDVSLRSILWFSNDVKLQPQYQAFTTYYDVWNKPERVYFNDNHSLYNVVYNHISLKLEDRDIKTYLSKLDRLIADFLCTHAFH